MIYKECEIYARVHVPGSDLYSLKEDGSLNESLGMDIQFHEQAAVVWFETEWGQGEMHKTIQEAKDWIDKNSSGESAE